jgi:hypothetical protein
MLVVFEVAATSVVFMVIKPLIVMLLVVHQPQSYKRLLQIPFPPHLPLFPMPIQPHLLLLMKGPPGVSSFVNNWGQPYRYQGICEYCKRPGHRTTQCYDPQRASGDSVVLGVGSCPAPPSTDAASPNFLLVMVGCDTLSTALVANTLVIKDLSPVVNVNLQYICLPTFVLVPVAGNPVPVACDIPPAPVPTPVVVRRNFNSLHHRFGHANLDSIRRTATYYGIKCVGDMTPCADCALAKIKKKSVHKTTSSRGNSPGYRLFVDISSSL